MKQAIATFFKNNPPDLPLLLGFSGGEDSLALAHLLLEMEIPFHMAHYDHSWRKTSSFEAKELENFARSKNEDGTDWYRVIVGSEGFDFCGLNCLFNFIKNRGG